MTFSFNHLGNHGHLGNQMFQYAFLVGMSIKHSRPYCIPPSEVFGKYYYIKLRSNIDDAFDIDCPRGMSEFPTINQRFFQFDEDLFNNPPQKNVNFLGYFQTEKWFAHCKNEIRRQFTFKSKYQAVAEEMRNALSGEVISLHIRRTDYVDNTNHESVGLEFYEKALKEVPDNSKVIIFTDDVEWAKVQPLFPDDRFYVSETDCPYIDMALMGLCDYHILANSSYSWWGAWLSNSKKIVAPSTWFGPTLSHNNTKDIFCEGWVKI
jgi:hypothetical protein